ncbi:phosphotriesterase family protein [Pseudooceanicola aestuarii]|uniref:phosphotriesterase family protein n=1 Tax=Pseudooceanicola aestuarii TaxID=2697319 RepID=UPI0013D3013D|nr:phosphotriesterase-related protein [Pseudooceanicola aestuarii]
MGNIRTVNGDISADGLGLIYSHEHLITCPPPVQKDRDLELDSYECSLQELKIFRDVGGTLLVEATTLDYGRDPDQMARMSREANVPVVAVSGFNKAAYFPLWIETTSLNGIADKLIRDVTEGMDGGPHKAGHLKSGGSYNFIHPLEDKTTRAVARAHHETGAPIWLHTEAGTMGNEMLDILQDEGVDLSEVVVGHCDRNADPYYHQSLANRGAHVQFDGVGKVKYHPDSTRIACIKAMLDAGHGSRLLISGDMGRAAYLAGYGGGPGFAYIATKFIPRMRAEGISDNAIEQIFKKTPAAWLAKF